MAIGTLKAVLTLDMAGFTTGLKSAQQSMKNVNDTMQEVGKQSQGVGSKIGNAVKGLGGFVAKVGGIKLVSGAIDMVRDSVGSAISRIDTLKNANRVFENMGFGADETSKMMENLKASINGLPTPLDGAVKGVQMLASSTHDIGKSQEIFSALNNGILGFGGSAQQVDGAIMQLSQAFSKGTVDGQTWNSLLSNGLGPALDAVAAKMGTTAPALKEGLSKGTIAVSDFQDALIDLNKNGGGGLASLEKIAQDATGGLATSLANMKTAVVRGTATMITAFDDGLKKLTGNNISEIMGKVGEIFENSLGKIGEAITWTFDKVAGVVEQFRPKIEPVITFITDAFTNVSENIVPLLVGAFQTIQQWLGVLFEYVGNLFSGENSIDKSFMKAFNAVADVALPILEDAVGFIKEMLDKLFAFWEENGDNIVTSVQTIWGWISDTVVTVMEFLRPFIETTWNNIKTVISTVLDVILGFVKIFSGILSGDWSAVMEGIKQVTSSVWNGIKGILSNSWDGIKRIAKETFEALKQSITEKWESLKGVASRTWENIKSAMMRPIESARDKIKEIVDKIKGFFDGMKLKLPDIKPPKLPTLPKLKITGSFSLNPISVPHIGWYATGGIATAPSVVGIGEAGDEAIVPLSNKSRMQPFAEAISKFMNKDDKGSNDNKVEINPTFNNTFVIRKDGDIKKISEELARQSFESLYSRGKEV